MKMLPGATQSGLQQVKPKKKCESAAIIFRALLCFYDFLLLLLEVKSIALHLPPHALVFSETEY